VSAIIDLFKEPDAVRAANVTAQATVQAAQIAANAARTNAYITTGGAVIALVGTVFAAIIAYINARGPVVRAEIEKEIQNAVLLAQFQASVRSLLSPKRWLPPTAGCQEQF
jgi:hypothetical protein